LCSFSGMPDSVMMVRYVSIPWGTCVHMKTRLLRYARYILSLIWLNKYTRI